MIINELANQVKELVITFQNNGIPFYLVLLGMFIVNIIIYFIIREIKIFFNNESRGIKL